MSAKTVTSMNGMEITIEIDKSSLQALAQRLSKERFDSIILDAMKRSTDYIEAQILKRITPGGVTAQGMQIDYGVSEGNAYGTITNNTFSGKMIQYGIPAGSSFPPPDVMELWAASKNITAYDNVTSLGFVLARAVSTHGVIAKQSFSKAMNQSKLIVNSIFAKALRQI